MIIAFLSQWLYVVSLLAGFALCGFGLLYSFSGLSRYLYFAAPFIGILIVPFGANTFYSLLNISYRASAGLSVACCILYGALRFAPNAGTYLADLKRSPALSLSVCAALTVAAAVISCQAVTLYNQAPSILYVWGTDHGSYAHLADWLNNHTVDARPQWLPTPDAPYDSWPALMFGIDPRFGSYGLLAITSTLYGTSGLFAYDLTCAPCPRSGNSCACGPLCGFDICIFRNCRRALFFALARLRPYWLFWQTRCLSSGPYGSWPSTSVIPTRIPRPDGFAHACCRGSRNVSCRSGDGSAYFRHCGSSPTCRRFLATSQCAAFFGCIDVQRRDLNARHCERHRGQTCVFRLSANSATMAGGTSPDPRPRQPNRHYHRP